MSKKAAVPKFHFHDLCHTHATLLLAKGVNVKVISERLGHNNIKITLDTYSHVLPTMQEDAVNKIEEIL
nr:tyrosine-type recombinase/integrase [Bacillus cereus]